MDKTPLCFSKLLRRLFFHPSYSVCVPTVEMAFYAIQLELVMTSQQFSHFVMASGQVELDPLVGQFWPRPHVSRLCLV